MYLQLPDEGTEVDEEELRQNMDLHQMISENTTLNHDGDGPPVSAEQVIEEIDEIMQVNTKNNNNDCFVCYRPTILCAQ